LQIFLKALNFSKNFFYKQPQDKYQEFCNAYEYYKKAILCDHKQNRQRIMQECITAWKEVKKNDTTFIENKIREYYDTTPSTICSHQSIFMTRNSTNSSYQTSTSKYISTPRQFIGFIDTTTIIPNAKSQHIAAEKINLAAKNVAEYQRMIEIMTDDSLKTLLSSKVIEEQKSISIQSTQLTRLKRHAEDQSRIAAKKQKMLEE